MVVYVSFPVTIIWPQANSYRELPLAWPKTRIKVLRGVLAISPTVKSPIFINCSFVFGPTPQISFAASGWRKSKTFSGSISNTPFGLQWLDAILAINLLWAIPTEQVIPSCSSTRRRIKSAICRPLPNNLLDPVTSKKASSNEIGSTNGIGMHLQTIGMRMN